jgi:hypothetical protein
MIRGANLEPAFSGKTEQKPNNTVTRSMSHMARMCTRSSCGRARRSNFEKNGEDMKKKQKQVWEDAEDTSEI